MKRLLSLSVCFLFLTALVSLPGQSQTVKDVLAKWIEAQGGFKTLEAIKDTTTQTNIEMVSMGMNGTATMYQKEPNKTRLDVEVMGMAFTAQAFDGEVAWMVNPQTGTAEQLPENFANEVKRSSLGIDSMLHPEKYGITYEFKGKEKIETKDYLVLEQTMSDGHKTTFYIDPETYLTYKAKGMTLGQAGVEVMAEQMFSDYRKVDGVAVAFGMITYQDGQEFMRMTVTKVTFNSNLEDSFFKMAK